MKRRPLTRWWLTDLEPECGCYVFYDAQGPLYAGSSYNLKERLTSHVLHYQTEITALEVFPCSFDELTGIEQRLIDNLRPRENRAKIAIRSKVTARMIQLIHGQPQSQKPGA